MFHVLFSVAPKTMGDDTASDVAMSENDQGACIICKVLVSLRTYPF